MKGQNMARRKKEGKSQNHVMFTRWVRLTPKKAKGYLKSQTELQRASKPKTIAKYQLALENNQWMPTGEPMQISPAGKLLNGQQRCEAVVASGKTIERQLVVFNVPEKAFQMMDRGLSRRLSDVLHAFKEVYTLDLQAALSILNHYLMGDKRISGVRPDFNIIAALKLLEEHPLLRDSITKALPAKGIVATTTAAVVHYLAWQVNEKKADRFIEQLASGANLSASSPIKRIRDKLMWDHRKQASRLTRTAKFAYLIMTWNAYYRQKPLKLSWRESNVSESIPRIAGLNW